MNQVIDYNITEAELETLKKSTAFAPTYETKKGAEESRVAIKACREMRVGVDKHRKELKADAIAYGKAVEAEAKRIIAIVKECEEPHATAKVEFENREKVRVANIKASIETINASNLTLFNDSLETCIARLSEIEATEITEALFFEFYDDAMAAKTEAIDNLKTAIEQKEAVAKVRVEREEIAAKELALKDAENKRLHEEAERQKAVHAEELRKEREETAEKQAVIDAENKAKQDAIDAEKQEEHTRLMRIEKEKQDAENERIKAEAAEAQRIADEKIKRMEEKEVAMQEVLDAVKTTVNECAKNNQAASSECVLALGNRTFELTISALEK